MINRIKSPIANFKDPFWSKIQLVVEMDSDHAVDSFIDYLKNTVYGLKIRKRGPYLERHDNIPIFSVPLNISNSITSLNQVSDYVNERYQLGPEDGYGAIISSSRNSSRKFVSLLLPHCFGDGKYFTFLIDHFLNKDDKSVYKNLPLFPYDLEEFCMEYSKKAPSNVKDEFHNDQLTRFFSNDKENIKGGDFNEFITLRFRDKDLKNKKITNNMVSLSKYTETLYMSNYFAICAHENKLLNSFGVINIVDLKKYSKKPVNFANCIAISSISPYTDHITSNMKNSDVGENLRKSIIEKLNNFEHFSFFPSAKFNQSLPTLKGNVTEFTNVGEVHIRKPIIDLWMALHDKCMDREIVSNMGFSVKRDDFHLYDKNERCGKSLNDMVLRYRYSPRKLSQNESNRLARSIEYFLKNVSLDEKVGDTFDKIRKFYNSI